MQVMRGISEDWQTTSNRLRVQEGSGHTRSLSQWNHPLASWMGRRAQPGDMAVRCLVALDWTCPSPWMHCFTKSVFSTSCSRSNEWACVAYSCSTVPQQARPVSDLTLPASLSFLLDQKARFDICGMCTQRCAVEASSQIRRQQDVPRWSHLPQPRAVTRSVKSHSQLQEGLCAT